MKKLTAIGAADYQDPCPTCGRICLCARGVSFRSTAVPVPPWGSGYFFDPTAAAFTCIPTMTINSNAACAADNGQIFGLMNWDGP